MYMDSLSGANHVELVGITIRKLIVPHACGYSHFRKGRIECNGKAALGIYVWF